jgi:hypothetical protein
METQTSKFVINREDRSRSIDPVTLVTDGLTIGNLPDCELQLNHPTVSEIHAGINQFAGDFYITHLSKSNSTTLNGKLVEGRAALSDGDTVQIGPFLLTLRGEGRALRIDVKYQPAVRVGDGAVEGEQATVAIADEVAPAPAAAAQSASAAAGEQAAQPTGGEDEGGTDAFDVFWNKRLREAGKIAKPSPLRPHAPARLGKTRHNWKPTRDLVRPWPVSLFTWAVVAVGVLSAAAAVAYTNAYSPAPLSDPHARSQLTSQTQIAQRANANSCTTCHTLRGGMEQNCASCHTTQTFSPVPLDAHAAAGVGCSTCHNEHRGRDFRPAVAALSADFQPGVASENTCTGCHNDANKKLYNGRQVFTPHRGTVGYPVVGGKWEWEGLSEAAWREKPEGVRQLLATWPAASENERRNAQFHALHLHRVRAVGGLKANESGELSCSSCHARWGTNIDRETPQKTCAVCHQGSTDERTGRALISASAPNCTSCHAQHPKQTRHWNASLLAEHK